MSRTSLADPEALMTHVSDMIRIGRFGVARPLLAAVERLAPTSKRLAELSARLAMGEGRLGEAEAMLDEAVARSPDDPVIRKWRAELRIKLENLPGAAADAAEAVILRRDDPVAKALLGTALIGMGRPADAVACLREAVAASPDSGFFHQSLAAAYADLGAPEAAARTLAGGIAACPGDVSMRNAAALDRIRHRDFAGALDLIEQARLAGVGDACLYGLKGHALSSLGRHDEAADAYAEALKLGPEDPYVRHLVAASGAVPGARLAPPEYLRAVFDGYAPRFDAHLISLGYRVPGLMRAALSRHWPIVPGGPELGPVLDLGCGSGLSAVALSDLPLRPMIGVDLSPGMLREARNKQLYLELHEMDLMAFLRNDKRRYPVILAGDVLCYFGALEEVFAAVRDRLADGGLFLLSVEEHHPRQGEQVNDRQGWVLGPQGRYAHHHDYVARVAAGFLVREHERQVPRHEFGFPVAGMMLVLERPRHDA